MKNTYYYLAGALLALMIAGCGKSSSSKNNNGSVGICGAGLVNTQYGCLQQGMCPAGQAQYNNNQCVPATTTTNQCAAGSVYSSQVGTCIPQGNCPMGQGLYNGQCVMADGMNNGYNNGYNNGGYNNYNNGYNYNSQYQYNNGTNPYMPQQNYNYYSTHPYYNPYYTPQYYYYGW